MQHSRGGLVLVRGQSHFTFTFQAISWHFYPEQLRATENKLQILDPTWIPIGTLCTCFEPMHDTVLDCKLREWRIDISCRWFKTHHSSNLYKNKKLCMGKRIYQQYHLQFYLRCAMCTFSCPAFFSVCLSWLLRLRYYLEGFPQRSRFFVFSIKYSLIFIF